MKRIEWVDYGKSLTIFFVVLIHTHFNVPIVTSLKAITMPMFFLMSGFLFSMERNADYGKFVYKRFRQLIVPYIWINIIAYALWFFFLRHYGNSESDNLSWQEPLKGVFMCVPHSLVHDIPLWSLACFFIVEVVYYPIYRWFKNALAISVVCFIIAALNNQFLADKLPYLPLCIAPCFASMAFYSLGVYLRSIDAKVLKQNFKNPIVYVALLAIYLTGALLNVRISFYEGLFGNYLYFLFSSFAGCLLVIQLCIFVANKWHVGRFIKFVSGGTLLICGFHILVYAFMKGVLLVLFHIEPYDITYHFFGGLAFAVFGYALCLPIIYVVKTYFRWLIAK